MRNNGENTVVIVTHNSLIAEVADRVIRLKNGKVESNEKNPTPKNIEEVNWYMLRRKMFRDIRFNLSQFITIFLMVFMGIMVYAGIRSYMDGMVKQQINFIVKIILKI